MRTNRRDARRVAREHRKDAAGDDDDEQDDDVDAEQRAASPPSGKDAEDVEVNGEIGRPQREEYRHDRVAAPVLARRDRPTDRDRHGRQEREIDRGHERPRHAGHRTRPTSARSQSGRIAAAKIPASKKNGRKPLAASGPPRALAASGGAPRRGRLFMVAFPASKARALHSLHARARFARCGGPLEQNHGPQAWREACGKLFA